MRHYILKLVVSARKTLPRQAKTAVVFYDCCVPRPAFEKQVIPQILAAHHLFVWDVFRPNICNHDPRLFLHINQLRKENFPDLRCVFVTEDLGFYGKVCHFEKIRIKRGRPEDAEKIQELREAKENITFLCLGAYPTNAKKIEACIDALNILTSPRL